MQRVDSGFPMWIYRHPARQLLGHVARLINQRAAAGVVTRLVKVKAHASDPLNEAADALATMTGLHPTSSVVVNTPGQESSGSGFETCSVVWYPLWCGHDALVALT